MRKLALLLLLFACPAWAQRQPVERVFARNFVLTTTTLTFCSSSTYVPTNSQIQTTGSSQTINATTPGQGTFGPLRAQSAATNDHIRVVLAGVESYLTVLLKPNDDTITIVESAVTIPAGTTFQYQTTNCGTTDADGWLPVGGNPTEGFVFEYNSGTWTNGINMQIHCRASPNTGGNPVIVYPSKGDTCGGGTFGTGATPGNFCNFPAAAAGIANRLYVGNVWPFAQCRIGVAGVAGASTSGVVNTYMIATVGAN
jgi:hypothetical protein